MSDDVDFALRTAQIKQAVPDSMMQSRLEIEQVRIIMNQVAMSVLMAPVLAIVITVLLWARTESHMLLGAWCFCIIFIYAWRLASQLRYRRSPPGSIRQFSRLGGQLTAIATITGLAWGSLIFLPLSGNDLNNTTLIAFVVGGITSAGVTTLAAHRRAALAFVIASLSPLTANLLLLQSFYGIGIMALLYFAVSINAINLANRNLIDNVRLRLMSEAQEAKVKASETQLRAHQELNDVISAAQSRFIRETDTRTLFARLLDDVLKLTSSEYGFIGEVLHDEHGEPYLKTWALSNVAWDQASEQLYAENAARGFEFRNLNTLFGAALKDRTYVISNEPAGDARAGGVPPGHPPLQAFLAAPLALGDRMLGLLGLANRPGGYTTALLDYLTPLLTTAAQLINANRSENERRATDQRLNRMHAQLQAFIAHTPAAVAMFDRELKFLAYSRRWSVDFALPGEDLIGQHLYSVLPDLPDLWREAYERALRGELQSEEADPYIRSDGTVRWLKWEARPWYESESQAAHDVSGIVLYCEDVTEAKRAADALHARDQLLTKLSARIPGMLFQLRFQPSTRRSSLLYVSEGAYSLYGKTGEELADDPDYMFRICHPNDIALMHSAINGAARNSGLLDLEHRIVLPDGHERWIHIEAALERLADASIIWHGYVQDISARKDSEAKLTTIAERLRLSTSAHGLGIWDWDVAANHLLWNDRMYEIYAAKPNEFQDIWHLWRARIHRDDWPRIKEESVQLQAPESATIETFLTEFRIVLPDSSVRRIRSRATIKRDANNAPIRLVGINWDMGLESNFSTTPLQHMTVTKVATPSQPASLNVAS